MKHIGNGKRGRGGRSGGRRHSHNANRSYDSNGPDVKVRGTASQVCDKYLTLAREATTSGDRIKAEGYFQHAEHYLRLQSGEQQQRQETQNRQNGRHVEAAQEAANQPQPRPVAQTEAADEQNAAPARTIADAPQPVLKAVEMPPIEEAVVETTVVETAAGESEPQEAESTA
ncbi:MAG TPA: DUF4167 domain-containing protein [Alphaproteobacteria bacterium]|jgi:hypothetical protein|nr:DUF4167 domain-containing protein [Alphaproteobacteria bacterium]MDP6270598.1 DUF4167 domain-containing protein [Alphaproteobacteria bacterium]MDP7429587.1 DUF4167 domain-containing protein [Alphaproteobacteria bacterium]HJM48326.1 DUF4167 domain-containing protein [Alphaproteobacteria bacterium]